MPNPSFNIGDLVAHKTKPELAFVVTSIRSDFNPPRYNCSTVNIKPDGSIYTFDHDFGERELTNWVDTSYKP